MIDLNKTEHKHKHKYVTHHELTVSLRETFGGLKQLSDGLIATWAMRTPTPIAERIHGGSVKPIGKDQALVKRFARNFGISEVPEKLDRPDIPTLWLDPNNKALGKEEWVMFSVRSIKENLIPELTKYYSEEGDKS